MQSQGSSSSPEPDSKTPRTLAKAVELARNAIREAQGSPLLIVIMGTSGSGKSTLATHLARELSVPFMDGDDLHSAGNIAKMSAGVALTDQDRTPWLQTIRKRALQATSSVQSHGVCVVACSALRRAYRDILRGLDSNSATTVETSQLRSYFICLRVSEAVLEKRLRLRASHFMKATMLRSQLETLQEPGPDEVDAVALSNDDDTLVEETSKISLSPRGLSISDSPALHGVNGNSDGVKLAQQSLMAEWTVQFTPGARLGTSTLGLPQAGAAVHPIMPAPSSSSETNEAASKQAYLTSLSAAVGYMRSELNDKFTQIKDELGMHDVAAPSTSMQTGSVRQATAAQDEEEQDEHEEEVVDSES